MSSHKDKLDFLDGIREEELDNTVTTPLYSNNGLSVIPSNWMTSLVPVVPSKQILKFAGSEIIMHDDGTIEINAAKGIKFKTDGDVEFDAKNVKVNTKKDIELGAANNITQQAPTIHLNPNDDASGYKG